MRIPARTRASRFIAIAALPLLGAAVLAPSQSQPPGGLSAAALDRAAPAEPGLSVLTYNVAGLPWPAGIGREAAMDRIGDRLLELRRSGRQPRIVLLQEAFTDAAKRIGREAGYRHIVAGPSQTEIAAPGRSPTEAAFIRAGDRLKGEGVGKMADSGLQILSDYPVLAVRRAAFGDDACAGYDCLANKGMVMVLIAVPGISTPIAVIDTHLNARGRSRVPIPRTLEAYRRQVAALDRFVRSAVPEGVPVIIAGDFNVGKAPDRQAALHRVTAGWLERAPGAGTGGVLRGCAGSGSRCGAGLSADALYSLQRNKDLQFALPGERVSLIPHRIAVPFGREPDGTMLSDHVGYTVYYRLTTA